MTDFYQEDEELEEDTLKDRYLTFLVGKETYGLEIRYVTEIVGIQAITEMPEMPHYIKGVINLRGNIIPVLDMRLRFRKEPRDYDDRTCVIVIHFGEITMGLIVDSVSEVLSIPEEEVSVVPGMTAGTGNGFVRQIGKTAAGVVLLLDCEKLLSAQELESMTAELTDGITA